MTERRASPAYRQGLNGFLRAALIHMRTTKGKLIRCPCHDCKNFISWDNIVEIEKHLIIRGFVDGYTCWTKHGEVPKAEQDSCNENMAVDPDEMADPDDEMEDLYEMSHNDENEMLDTVNEVTDDDDCDADGDDVDIPNLRAMLRHFEKGRPEVPQ